jgi:FKBP-type peptidyl-prolyl cis-trans isomerase
MAERTGQRVAAFALAAVFFFSSVALTGFVIWQIRKDSKATTEQNLPEQTPTPPTNNQQETSKLKGTQLANFTPITEPVGSLQAIDLKEGTGDTVATGASVTVHYTGALTATGIIFESSKDSGQPASFPLSGVIQGWQQGVPGMKVGGTRRLIIPYALAYGEAGSPPSIPAKADLVFDIELISIN